MKQLPFSLKSDHFKLLVFAIKIWIMIERLFGALLWRSRDLRAAAVAAETFGRQCRATARRRVRGRTTELGLSSHWLELWGQGGSHEYAFVLHRLRIVDCRKQNESTFNYCHYEDYLSIVAFVCFLSLETLYSCLTWVAFMIEQKAVGLTRCWAEWKLKK